MDRQAALCLSPTLFHFSSPWSGEAGAAYGKHHRCHSAVLTMTHGLAAQSWIIPWFLTLTLSQAAGAIGVMSRLGQPFKAWHLREDKITWAGHAHAAQTINLASEGSTIASYKEKCLYESCKFSIKACFLKVLSSSYSLTIKILTGDLTSLAFPCGI